MWSSSGSGKQPAGGDNRLAGGGEGGEGGGSRFTAANQPTFKRPLFSPAACLLPPSPIIQIKSKRFFGTEIRVALKFFPLCLFYGMISINLEDLHW